MPTYTLSMPISLDYTFPTNLRPACEIYTTAVDRPRVIEFAFNSSTASVIVLGVGRPATIGLLPKNASLFQATDPSDPPSTVKMATDWAQSPTVPAIYLRRATLHNVQGGNITWRFQQGLVIPVSSSIVLWSISGNTQGTITAVVDL